MRLLSLDFEYRNQYDPVCCSLNDGTSTKTFWLEDGANYDEFREYILSKKDYTFLCYSANADIDQLCNYGIDISTLKVIDLFIESKMVMMTHKSHISPSYGLLDALLQFSVINYPQKITGGKEKKEVVYLILNTFEYTTEDVTRIKNYCESDIEHLASLLSAVQEFHNKSGTGYGLKQMLEHGTDVVVHVALSRRSKGIPVNKYNLDLVFNNALDIRSSVCGNINDTYNIELFKEQKIKGETRYVAKKTGFSKLVYSLGLEDDWEKTETGAFSQVDKYISAKAKLHPKLMPLYDANNILKDISTDTLKDKRLLIDDYEGRAYIKAISLPFNQKSSRDSPLPSKGFLFNCSPFVKRAFIKPHVSEVIITSDWKSQEIAIAAAYSGDKELKSVYEKSDIYLALAAMAGYIPDDWEDDVKSSKAKYHGIRQTFKAIQLAIGYGKSWKSLGSDLFLVSGGSLTKPEALDKARSLFDWHKKTFHVFWDWIYAGIRTARQDGYIIIAGNFVYYVDYKTRDTQLMNIRIQAAGARMARMAKKLILGTDLELIAFLHDGSYVLSSEESKEADERTVISCLDEASNAILGGFLKCPASTSIYTPNKLFEDPRSDRIMKYLAGSGLNLN